MRRRIDNAGLLIAWTSLLIVVVHIAVTLTFAQTQDAINATLTERTANLALRLDTIEWYMRTTIVGVIGNLVAYIVTIRSQVKGRRS